MKIAAMELHPQILGCGQANNRNNGGHHPQITQISQIWQPQRHSGCGQTNNRNHGGHHPQITQNFADLVTGDWEARARPAAVSLVPKA